MAKNARNAPCPCGSGRKYKHCCLLEEEQLAKQARDDGRVGRSISDWSVEQFGDELAEAFEEFHPESHRIGERDFALLLTWFNSDRELSGGGTPVARYLARSGLDPDERDVAERIAAAQLGLYRVRAVALGHSLELENVLTGASIAVASQTVSCEVLRWDVVLCRVMSSDTVATLWGPVLVYAPDEEAELLAELERLAAAYGLSRDRAGLSEVFRLASRELLRFVPLSRSAEPSLFTAEGDRVVVARARWSLADPDDAFWVLDAPPELLWVGESEDGTGECFQLTGDRAELLARRPPLPPNALFFESSYVAFPDRIGTGTFVLAGCELRFDAISEQRLEHALKLVSRRLGGNAQLLEREIAPLELDRTEQQQAVWPSEEDARAAGYLDEYLRRWLDEPLAHLDGATPRAAASIPELRGELEFLLRAIENRAEHARRAGAAWPDVGWLWDALDLTTQLAA
ncbi:MAG: SEC-C domain-containing protein [Solirubrobacteraceae bacterium]